MRSFVFIICSFFSSLVFAQANMEMPQHISLNGQWSFAVDSLQKGLQERWFETGLPSGKIYKVTVPHTWNIQEGLESYTGSAWYEREIIIPRNWRGKLVRLHFYGIYRDASIWLNNQNVGVHKASGYTEFFVDVSKAIRTGNNKLAILVNNDFSNHAIPYGKSFDWANDGGIYRKVEIIATEHPAIDYVNAVATPFFTGDTTTGNIAVKVGLIAGNKSARENVMASISLTEKQNPANVIINKRVPVSIKDNALFLNLPASNIKLWDINHPFLYILKIRLLNDEVVSDEYVCNIGFRTIEVRDAKIWLNKEPVRLAGIEWTPGSNPLFGMAEPNEYLEQNLKGLKKLNAVFTRFHWQQDEFVLNWCDENGLLVQEEIPFWGKEMKLITPELTIIAKQQAKEMLSRHFNHPSIISWGVGNELPGLEKETREYMKTLYQYFKASDSSRLVNYVSNTLHRYSPLDDASAFSDILMWNEYYGTWYGADITSVSPMLDKINAAYPGKPIVISEYGVCEPAFTGGDDLRVRHMLSHTAIYAAKPFVAGAIYFDYNDYRTFVGEEGYGKFRQRVHGVTDLYGKPKTSSKFLGQMFSPLIVYTALPNVTNDSINVEFSVSTGLPKYILNGYFMLLAEDEEGREKISENKLPVLYPGEKYNQTLLSNKSTSKWLIFKRPTGEKVWCQKVK